jgi:hypothetical protein
MISRTYSPETNRLDRVLHAILAERLLFAIRGAVDTRVQVLSALPSSEFHVPRPRIEEENTQYTIGETLSE